MSQDSYFGATVGRFANRIANGTFTLDGTTYHLPINNPPNHLHGGFIGFNKRIWSVKRAEALINSSVLELTYTSPNGEQNYPGTVQILIRYTLSDDNSLQVDYEATSDANTIINIANHSYFNLAVGKVVDIRNHWIEIHAQEYTPIDETMIPTGEIRKTRGTPFDFYNGNYIGSRMAQVGGYDHNFVLQKMKQTKMTMYSLQFF